MRYGDEELEIIDAFEDIEPVSHIMNKPENKKEETKKATKYSVKKEKRNNYNKDNKLLFNSIIFLPICSLIYLISLRLAVLFDKDIYL